MKFFVVAFALVAVASADVSHLFHGQAHQAYHAAAAGPEATAAVLRQDADVLPDSYQYAFETSNGISAQERGQVKNFGRDEAAIEVEGQNQYTAPDGQKIAISYIANEFGYQPQGAHLPTPPAPQPIPEYIVRALKWIEAHPQKPESIQRF